MAGHNTCLGQDRSPINCVRWSSPLFHAVTILNNESMLFFFFTFLQMACRCFLNLSMSWSKQMAALIWHKGFWKGCSCNISHHPFALFDFLTLHTMYLCLTCTGLVKSFFGWMLSSQHLHLRGFWDYLENGLKGTIKKNNFDISKLYTCFTLQEKENKETTEKKN